MFIHAFPDVDEKLSQRIRRSASTLAGFAALLTIAQHLLAPARMAASFDGVLDSSLQTIYLFSDAGIAHGMRLAGILIVMLGLALRRGWLLLTGAVLACLSFAAMGHVVTHSPRWLLAGLLVLHVVIIAFWFGSLRPC